MSQPPAGSGNEQGHTQLRHVFDTSPDHGKSINLSTYPIHDCVCVLLDYIATVPELLGRARHTRKHQRPKMRSEKEFAILLATLAEPNLELLMVTIAFFAAYAELGRAQASLVSTPNLSYPDLIWKLAELFYTIVVRPHGPSDRLSVQTMELVLEQPIGFRSIVMLERSKRAQTRREIPSQPFFQIHAGAFVDSRAGQDEYESQSWSRCAMEGEEPQQNRDVYGKEACSSDEMSVENFDSEFFDAIEPEPVTEPQQAQSGVQVIQAADLLGVPQGVDQPPQEHNSEITAGCSQNKGRFHESRLIRRRDTTEESLATTVTSMIPAHPGSSQQGIAEPSDRVRPEIWGLSVSDATSIAGHNMDSIFFTIYGVSIPFSGRVPIVVAKCIEKVICTGSAAG